MATYRRPSIRARQQRRHGPGRKRMLKRAQAQMRLAAAWAMRRRSVAAQQQQQIGSPQGVPQAAAIGLRRKSYIRLTRLPLRVQSLPPSAASRAKRRWVGKSPTGRHQVMQVRERADKSPTASRAAGSRRPVGCERRHEGSTWHKARERNTVYPGIGGRRQKRRGVGFEFHAISSVISGEDCANGRSASRRPHLRR